jgi:hypothetical protein
MPLKVTGGKGSTDIEGQDSKATGALSHAEGSGSTASGDYSHAEGSGSTASGDYSHVEGYQTHAWSTYAHTEGYRTSASGSMAHAEGYQASASASASHAEGFQTSADGTASHAEGLACYATAEQSHAEGLNTQTTGVAAHSEGRNTLARGNYSHAQGAYATASRLGQDAVASGRFVANGDAQSLTLVLSGSTTDDTAKALTAGGGLVDASGGADTNVLTVPVNRAHRFRIEAVARNTAADEFAGWTITGTIVRGSSGNARFIAAPTVVTEADAAASAWTLVASIDTTDSTNNYLLLSATGGAAKTIRWVAALYATEVG